MSLFTRYLHIFWEPFFQSEELNDNDGATGATSRWSTASKKLSWNTQMQLLENDNELRACEEEIKKKASAWFRVTYEPWMIHLRRHSRMNTRSAAGSDPPNQQRQLFSFAWLVYPVLFSIFQGRTISTKNRRRSKKKRNRRKKTGKTDHLHTAVTTDELT